MKDEVWFITTPNGKIGSARADLAAHPIILGKDGLVCSRFIFYFLRKMKTIVTTLPHTSVFCFTCRKQV
uniref:Uncharacterized protein n=1 Tax=Oryza brachyantha TaxID=4533 RepID=J3LAS6_ORYBR